MPLALTLLAAVGNGVAWYRLSRRGHRWPARRAACMLAGSLCVGIALLPPLASHDDRFEVHVIQHLLLAMVAPAFLALSAPATLALRTLPRRARRALLRMLHSPAVSVLTAPATAVTLDLGGLYVLYLTGLYQAAEHDSVIHAVVHLHMFLAGCLLSWAVIGIDPIRRVMLGESDAAPLTINGWIVPIWTEVLIVLTLGVARLALAVRSFQKTE